jgi:threonine/homoserine/homoserine lactone efflux protein
MDALIPRAFYFFQSLTGGDTLEVGILGIGVLMGIAFAAPPGAVTAETIRRGVRGGFAIAFGVQLGSLIGDATYAILALGGLAALAENYTMQIALGAFGAMFLMYLAWSSFQSARLVDLPVVAAHPGSQGRWSRDFDSTHQQDAFLSGLTLSLTNPWAIAFWLSLGGGLASLGLTGASGLQNAMFFSSFMLGSALWALILSIIIARVRGWIRPVVFRAISILCGLALGAFGLIAASHVIGSVIGISS